MTDLCPTCGVFPGSPDDLAPGVPFDCPPFCTAECREANSRRSWPEWAVRAIEGGRALANAHTVYGIAYDEYPPGDKRRALRDAWIKLMVAAGKYRDDARWFYDRREDPFYARR